MTFAGRRPLVEEDLRWKMTFGGRRPLVEDDLQWKTTYTGSLHGAYSALRHVLIAYGCLSDVLILLLTHTNLYRH